MNTGRCPPRRFSRGFSFIFSLGAVTTVLLASALVGGCGNEQAADGFDIGDGSLRGELAVYMSDDSDGRTEEFYALRAPSGVERRLLFDIDVSHLTPGIEIKVWGAETPDGFRVASFREVSPPIVETKSALKSGAAFRDRSFAFVLLDLGGGVNLTSETVMNRMVNDANSIRNYFLYDSYGRQNITAQVFGPIRATLSACNTRDFTNAALRAMVPNTFQHYLWYFGNRQTACPWAGLASVGTAATPSKDTWYNGSSGCVVLVQEPGHNFGMQHSSSIRCPGTPLADDTMGCTASEYGDPFDPMGGGCRHMNAWQKAYQGWFGGCNGVTVNSSGTFTLLPYEMRCDGAQFLKIKAPKTRMISRTGGGGAPTNEILDYYYVELRTPLDFDGPLGGGQGLSPRVLLHIANDIRVGTSRAIHPYIIDMTPATAGNGGFSDAGFSVGQTFNDPAGGLSITATAVSATQATITVEMAGGGAAAPTCLDDSPFAAPGPGPETCVTNPATPVGTAPPMGGTGGTPVVMGTGGAMGVGGQGGIRGTGGTPTGMGGARATGGVMGTPGTGGAVGTGGVTTVPPGTGGANATGGSTMIATGGSSGTGTGGTIPDGNPNPMGSGGAAGRQGPGVDNGDVVGGCGCAMSPDPLSTANLAGTVGGLLLLLLGGTRRRAQPAPGSGRRSVSRAR